MNETVRLPELDELAEQIGEFIHYWGFKRVHGRIWTHLFLASRPLDAAELVRRMRISKALISISLRELLEYDVIQHAGRSDRGTHLYRTNPDILSVILNVLRQRERRLLSRVVAAQDSLGRVAVEERAAFGLSEDKFKALQGLNDRASAALESLIALRSVDFGEWRNAFLAGDEGDELEDLGTSPNGRSPSRGQDRDDDSEDAVASFARTAAPAAKIAGGAEDDEVVLPAGRSAVGEGPISFGAPAQPWMRK